LTSSSLHEACADTEVNKARMKEMAWFFMPPPGAHSSLQRITSPVVRASY
jgi:hypothetical protein